MAATATKSGIGASVPSSIGDSTFVQGTGEVLRNLNKAISELLFLTQEGLVEGGKLLRTESRRRTPVDTGDLRTNVTVTHDPFSSKWEVFHVVVAYQEHYAVYVHEIWAHHRGSPLQDWKFMERAMTEERERLLRVIGEKSRPNW